MIGPLIWNKPGRPAKIRIDGMRDIKVIRAVSRNHAGGWVGITVELLAREGGEKNEVVLTVPDETQAALVALGWTPPAAVGEPGQVEPEPEISVYSERAHLIAYLATQYPAKIAYNDPNEPDWPVIYLDTVYGQLSWHLAAGDLWLFPHIPVVGPGDEIPQWDGHTTAQKYERLRKLTTLKSDD